MINGRFIENEYSIHYTAGVHKYRNFTYIFVSEASENFDFAQRSLTVRLMLEWRNLFDGNFCMSHFIDC